MAPGYPKASEFIEALALRPLLASGWVRYMPANRMVEPPELYVLLGNGAFFWLRADGSYVSGSNPHGERYAKRFGMFDRWRLRRAVKAWAERNPGK